MENEGLKHQDLKDLGKWCGSIYRLDKDNFGVKLTGHHAVVIKFEDVMRLLFNETVEEKRLRESGR